MTELNIDQIRLVQVRTLSDGAHISGATNTAFSSMRAGKCTARAKLKFRWTLCLRRKPDER